MDRAASLLDLYHDSRVARTTRCPYSFLVPAFFTIDMLFPKQLPASREGFQAWGTPQVYHAGEGLRKAQHSLPTSLPNLQTQHFLLHSKRQLFARDILLRWAKSRAQAEVNKSICGQDKGNIPVLDFRPGIGQALLSKSPGEDRQID